MAEIYLNKYENTRKWNHYKSSFPIFQRSTISVSLEGDGDILANKGLGHLDIRSQKRKISFRLITMSVGEVCDRTGKFKKVQDFNLMKIYYRTKII